MEKSTYIFFCIKFCIILFLYNEHGIVFLCIFVNDLDILDTILINYGITSLVVSNKEISFVILS